MCVTRVDRGAANAFALSLSLSRRVQVIKKNTAGMRFSCDWVLMVIIIEKRKNIVTLSTVYGFQILSNPSSLYVANKF